MQAWIIPVYAPGSGKGAMVNGPDEETRNDHGDVECQQRLQAGDHFLLSTIADGHPPSTIPWVQGVADEEHVAVEAKPQTTGTPQTVAGSVHHLYSFKQVLLIIEEYSQTAFSKMASRSNG